MTGVYYTPHSPLNNYNEIRINRIGNSEFLDVNLNIYIAIMDGGIKSPDLEMKVTLKQFNFYTVSAVLYYTGQVDMGDSSLNYKLQKKLFYLLEHLQIIVVGSRRNVACDLYSNQGSHSCKPTAFTTELSRQP